MLCVCVCVCVWRAREREISLVYVGICTRSTTEWLLFTQQISRFFNSIHIYIYYIHKYKHLSILFDTQSVHQRQLCCTTVSGTFFLDECFFHHTIIFFLNRRRHKLHHRTPPPFNMCHVTYRTSICHE
jgi:hypothetical protein